MIKFGDFFKKLNNPTKLIVVLTFLTTILSATASIIFIFISKESQLLTVISYVVYVIAACSLSYTVYLIVKFVPKAKSSFSNFIERHKTLSLLAENYGLKTTVFSCCSFAATIIFATMNFVSAIRYKLLWFASLSVYYLALTAFRGGVLLTGVKNKKRYAKNPKLHERKKWQSYLFGGIFLTVVAITSMLAVTQMVISEQPIQKGEIMTIANAAYTFYKSSMAVYNLFKARKYHDPVIQTLRNVNLADACMAIVALTTLMLSTFNGGSDLSILKALVGFAACIAIISIAIVMIIQGKNKLKTLKEQDNE